jgi:hypothetical protein
VSTPAPGSSDDDNLSEGIFSRTDYAAGQPPPKEFKPWHLPRKQFVRREQWIVQARRIFERRADSSPVRYLGLPGIDLLDLRYLHEHLCSPLNRPLRFLGFNSEAASNNDALVDLNTSIDEVTRLGNVDPQSEVVRDDFRSLARANSMAHRKTHLLGPFDVVNLDLCDGIASDDPACQGTLYDAIAALVALQVRSPHPWTLLVTSRIGRDHFHDHALGELLDRFYSNLTTCQDFAKVCAELLGAEDPANIVPASFPEPVFLRVVLIALCKWLLALGQTQSANRVELASCLGYRVNRGAPCEDLVSFALIFEPVIEPTANPLRAEPAPPVDECSEAARMARRARSFKDVDGILDGDAALHEELVRETSELLRAARYNPDEFRSWLVESPSA